ncbi:ABC transporter permease [Ferrimonas marina]|uniref:Putative ABC transport system permease protein n=1 Tax=Ferrimonas marina TaxID=299255 RepID=A0A1M5RFH3_9GAMM|nr:ABC transporter permease [Ferrimonas marina]SHH24938.1 putative ABC transport system permease protein [Ferrimonas marina]
MLSLMLKSLRNRLTSVCLTLTVIAIAVALFIGVEVVRNQAKQSFANTISGTDLVVGARSGNINLLLYSVFRLGNATNNIGYDTYERLAQTRGVAWTIPLSLGDSHRGYRVVGTNQDYFTHYQFGQRQSLSLAQGEQFDSLFDVVLGAEVARKLGYDLGEEIVLSHGAGASVSFSEHDDMPFTVVGILAATGTPVDRSLHVSLEAIEAIHVGWQGGTQTHAVNLDQLEQFDLTPKTITAFLVGLESKFQLLNVQRAINTNRSEPLSAVLPGMALAELWTLLDQAEKALAIVAGFVVAVGLTGMLTTLLASLSERRREMAILRAMGAGPRHVFLLLWVEAAALALVGTILGYLLAQLCLLALAPYALAQYGLVLSLAAPTGSVAWMMLSVQVAGSLAGIIPAWRAYRHTLADGLTQRL